MTAVFAARPSQRTRCEARNPQVFRVSRPAMQPLRAPGEPPPSRRSGQGCAHTLGRRSPTSTRGMQPGLRSHRDPGCATRRPIPALVWRASRRGRRMRAVAAQTGRAGVRFNASRMIAPVEAACIRCRVLPRGRRAFAIARGAEGRITRRCGSMRRCSGPGRGAVPRIPQAPLPAGDGEAVQPPGDFSRRSPYLHTASSFSAGWQAGSGDCCQGLRSSLTVQLASSSSACAPSSSQTSTANALPARTVVTL
jgi:hypothetical protein